MRRACYGGHHGENGVYHAGPGWNACTGLGTPIGDRLLEALAGGCGGVRLLRLKAKPRGRNGNHRQGITSVPKRGNRSPRFSSDENPESPEMPD